MHYALKAHKFRAPEAQEGVSSMKVVTERSVADVETLAPSWQLSLRAERKSPATLQSYGYATAQYVAFARANGMPTDVTVITREHIEAFLVDVLERRSASTAEARYRGLRSSSPGASPRARSAPLRWHG
jgi:hypothetical protein